MSDLFDDDQELEQVVEFIHHRISQAGRYTNGELRDALRELQVISDDRENARHTEFTRTWRGP